ncbi:molybdopterin-dependent oxidoreductase [Streptomyces sp. NPDC085639]|uniref:molybdopterin-dependent oxidoreductase n=1 Tax=Streptomyces sp. NPDC085639 TaxID=3365734 RepID=UPI0037D2736E
MSASARASPEVAARTRYEPPAGSPAAARGPLHGDLGRDRPARRHVDEREPRQPGGPGLRQRPARRGHERGAAFDARRRKDRSRFLLAVSGGDGHHTVLAWAELDADFGDSPVLLATRLDGQDLDASGAQLVVPSGRCGARCVSAVTHVWFGSLAAPVR